jgi:hypothetical protein
MSPKRTRKLVYKFLNQNQLPNIFFLHLEAPFLNFRNLFNFFPFLVLTGGIAKLSDFKLRTLRLRRGISMAMFSNVFQEDISVGVIPRSGKSISQSIESCHVPGVDG